MNFIKELSNLSSHVVEGSQSAKDTRGYSRFQQSFDLIQKQIDQLNVALKETSQFRKLAVQLGGDDGFAKGALKALKELENEVLDLHMSVGTAQEFDSQYNSEE